MMSKTIHCWSPLRFKSGNLRSGDQDQRLTSEQSSIAYQYYEKYSGHMHELGYKFIIIKSMAICHRDMTDFPAY